MARTSNPQVEQRLLICALETRSPKIRAEILSNTTEEDYSSEDGSAVRARMNVLLGMGKSLGSAVDFSEDPALSESAQAFVKSTPSRRKKAGQFSMDRVKDLVHTLKMYRSIRLIYEMQSDVSDLAIGEVNEEGIEEIGSCMEKTLVGIREGFDKQPLSHLGKRQDDEVAKKMLRKMLKFEEGQFVSTGLPGIDKHLYGWERGNLVTLSGPRGGGKSTMAMVMAINQYLKANLNVCFVSMEMSEKDLWRRVTSNISRVPHDTIRYTKYMTESQRRVTGKAFKQFHRHGRDSNCTFTVWDVKDSYFTPQKLESALAPFMYDVIFIDYLTLFSRGRQDLWEAQLEYSRYLKGTAKRLNCVPVVLTQLSDEERVKYGKGIEENTDYWMWWKWGEEEEETGKTDLRMDKARHAAKKRFPALFMFDIMQIDTTIGSSATSDAAPKAEGVVNADVFSNAGAY